MCHSEEMLYLLAPEYKNHTFSKTDFPR